MPERYCLTYLPTDDLDIGEIQRTVSQSELIEPLGAETHLPKLAFTLRCPKPPTEAGIADLPKRALLPASVPTNH